MSRTPGVAAARRLAAAGSESPAAIGGLATLPEKLTRAVLAGAGYAEGPVQALLDPGVAREPQAVSGK